jgi:hypothetical protein
LEPQPTLEQAQAALVAEIDKEDAAATAPTNGWHANPITGGETYYRDGEPLGWVVQDEGEAAFAHYGDEQLVFDRLDQAKCAVEAAAQNQEDNMPRGKAKPKMTVTSEKLGPPIEESYFDNGPPLNTTGGVPLDAPDAEPPGSATPRDADDPEPEPPRQRRRRSDAGQPRGPRGPRKPKANGAKPGELPPTVVEAGQYLAKRDELKQKLASINAELEKLIDACSPEAFRVAEAIEKAMAGKVAQP